MRLITAISYTAVFLGAAFNAHAGLKIADGPKAKAMYEDSHETSYVLRQKDRSFRLKSQDGTIKKNQSTLRISQSDVLFITNEEESLSHHIYDATDRTWIMKQQKPADAVALTFTAPGKHIIRCAVHPKMKMTVIVE